MSLFSGVRVSALFSTVVFFATTVAAAPNGSCARVALPAEYRAAPPDPPNGTYVFALSRNGADEGSTTVTIFRRDDAREIEVDEAGSFGAARVHVLAGYRYADLSLASYVATYQAPFLRTSAVGSARRTGTASGFYDQATLRYRIDGANAVVSVDGAARLLPVVPLPSPSSPANPPRTRYVFDAPFMASVLLLPAFRRRSGATDLAPLAAAFDATAGASTAPMRLVRAAPQSPKTPKSDLALQVRGIATVWFQRGNGIVDEAHFDALNVDARLVSYARTTDPAPFLPAPSPTPDVKPVADAVTIDRDPRPLQGVVDLPALGKGPEPIVVLVPPGPAADRNFGGAGPTPMFAELARDFTARGYAVLRYDTPGVGKSGGSSGTVTWEQSLTDAQAAIRAAADRDGIDRKRVYVAGYGNGADLALAAAGTADVDVAGAIALAPTVVSYLACARQVARARARDDAAGFGLPNGDGSGLWSKSSSGHDPAVLAQRATVPLFVLHPGLPTCAETNDEIETYDDRLRLANPRVTIVVATDLSEYFGGRFDADSAVNTQEFFPYRFDASTANALADWLDGPKIPSAARNSGSATGGPAGRALPPPPPAPGAAARHEPLPPRTSAPAVPASAPAAASSVAPGQPALPATLGSPVPVTTAPPVPASAPAAT